MARIVGTSGRDVLRGTNGNDKLIGRGGNDKLIGKGGNDTLIGGKGKDTLIGGKGKDKLKGGAGNDKLNGGNGNDTLNGQKGNDKLDAGKGNDKLNGGSGNDLIDGGPGADNMFGGSGADTFKFDAGDGFYTGWPGPLVPNAVFDDVINDFSGAFIDGFHTIPGQGDKLDIPASGFGLADFGPGEFVIYLDDAANLVGSFLVANTHVVIGGLGGDFI